MPASSPARTRVFLHVGPPKTGTTYLQGVLRHWHAELESAGVLFPAVPTHDHFNAALDLRGRHDFGIGAGRDSERPRARGAWARLVGATLAHRGTVVISHELFATADAEHAARGRADLAGTDLHVVVTARDPARQLVSSWQERVKQGSTRPFGAVARRLASGRGWASAAQDLPAVLERWGAGLPPDHVHVVTVPPSGSDPTLLWRRFASVVGIDPDSVDPAEAPYANESLGVAEIELLRQVNQALDGRVPHPDYSQVVTALYAQDILARHRQSPQPVLPRRLRGRVDALADSWIAAIRDRGYHVVGDLEDLRPRYAEGGHPRRQDSAQMASVAVVSTADLLVAVAAMSHPRNALRQVVSTTSRHVAYAMLSTGQRIRYRLSGRRTH